MAATYASVVNGSSRGLATTLSPTHTSMPALSHIRAMVQQSSTSGRRADCMITARCGNSMPIRMASFPWVAAVGSKQFLKRRSFPSRFTLREEFTHVAADRER